MKIKGEETVRSCEKKALKLNKQVLETQFVWTF